MIRSLLLVALMVAGSFSAFGCSRPDTVRVMSFNVRYAAANDGPNDWGHRRALVLKTIRAIAPDILGLQEPLASQMNDLSGGLSEYDYVGVGRNDGVRAGEFAPIFYRKDRLAVIEQGVFWLSPQPDEPGSVGWDAALPRIATWAKLHFKEAALPDVHVVNVHFDHQGEQARLESAKMVREYVTSLGDCPVLVMGDFNCAPASEPYEAIMAKRDGHMPLYDAFGSRETIGTHHSFTGAPGRGRIDWILFSPHFESIEATVDRRHFMGRYPSDHFPVIATLRMRGGCRAEDTNKR